MNTKVLILALSAAAIAAGKALTDFADQLPEDFDGDAGFTQGTIATGSIDPNTIANVELDAAGLPWDGRIHAGTKTKTQKNIWTKLKGVADNVFEAVTAELRQQYPAPVAAAPVVTAPVTTAPVVAAAPVVNIPVIAQTNYAKLSDWLAKNTGEGKILSAAWIEAAFAQNSTNLAALAADEDRSLSFLEAFRNALKSSGGTEVA